MHTLLDLHGNIPTFIRITDGKVHDVKILDEIMPEAGAFYVMDRGYVDFERLFVFTLSSAFFVVRTKSNVLLQRRYLHKVDKSTGVRSDHTVILTSFGSASVYPDALRRISIWAGREQVPKTPNAVRVVDVAEPLAQSLRELVAGKTGYLFAAKNGKPLDQRNVLRALHATGKKVGLHSFRRFRAETLRRSRVPEDLIKLWLGHSKHNITDLYAIGLEKDEAWRREWCERAGLGFALVGLLGLQNVVAIDSVKAA